MHSPLKVSHSTNRLSFVDDTEDSFTFLSKWTRSTSGWQNFVTKNEVEVPLNGFLSDAALRIKIYFKVPNVFFPLFVEMWAYHSLKMINSILDSEASSPS